MLERAIMEFNIFTKGIKHLKGYFPTWNFDINNVDAMEVWYLALENLSNEEYGMLIQTYCKREQYPPISPNSLLKYYTFKSSEEVFKWIENLNDQHPYNNEYTRGKFYQELNKDEIAYQVFKDIEKGLDDYSFFDKDLKFINSNGLEMLIGYGWLKNLFISNYEIAREKHNPIYRLSKYRDDKSKELKFETKKAIEYRR